MILLTISAVTVTVLTPVILALAWGFVPHFTHCPEIDDAIDRFFYEDMDNVLGRLESSLEARFNAKVPERAKIPASFASVEAFASWVTSTDRVPATDRYDAIKAATGLAFVPITLPRVP